MNYETLLLALSLAAYVITGILYLRQLFSQRQLWGRATLALLLFGLVLHLAALFTHSLSRGNLKLPIENVLETLSFSAWCLVLVFVFAESRWKLTALGAFVLPVAIIALAGSFIAYRHAISVNVTRLTGFDPTLLGVHVTLVIVGYAAFTLAFCAACACVVQDNLLKRKHLVGISRQLPPVQVADEAAYRLAALGFPIFSLGIVIGVIWANLTQPKGWMWDPKVVWSVITWLVFAVYLHVRMANGWKGRRAAILLMSGFGCAIVTYLVTGLLRIGWHHFL
jgi:cytochrome c-type biogenesis protein CcsB